MFTLIFYTGFQKHDQLTTHNLYLCFFNHLKLLMVLRNSQNEVQYFPLFFSPLSSTLIILFAIQPDRHKFELLTSNINLNSNKVTNGLKKRAALNDTMNFSSLIKSLLHLCYPLNSNQNGVNKLLDNIILIIVSAKLHCLAFDGEKG